MEMPDTFPVSDLLKAALIAATTFFSNDPDGKPEDFDRAEYDFLAEYTGSEPTLAEKELYRHLWKRHVRGLIESEDHFEAHLHNRTDQRVLLPHSKLKTWLNEYIEYSEYGGPRDGFLMHMLMNEFNASFQPDDFHDLVDEIA